MIREAQQNDLEQILNLYLDLHEKEIPSNNEHLRNTWQQIIDDKNHHLIVCEIDGRIVSSCVCVYSKLNKECQTVCLYRKCCYYGRI